ncbi:hypothetical protein EJB05_45013 [Eragrostis curvula]|uniref:Uncharacterized protein n=1 Tax=Eragrostis curvula TaxID=38414 RepID=A0A5J9TJQ5_9POAL|nr:hypothetical protein EJB05_45013 [Eragrostis curvula]
MRLLDIYRGRPASLLPSPSLPLRQIRRAAAAAAPAPPSSPPVDPTHHPTRGRLRRQPWSRLCRTTTREWRRRQDRDGHVFLVTGGASPVLPQLADFPCTQVNLPIPRSPSLFSPSFNPRSVVAACSIPCDLGPAAMDEAVAGSLVLPISMSPSQVQNGYITLQSNLDVKISFRWTKRVPGASVAPPVQQPILECPGRVVPSLLLLPRARSSCSKMIFLFHSVQAAREGAPDTTSEFYTSSEFGSMGLRL